MNEWISVDERLPDHGGTVVCRTADRQLQFGRVMTVRKYDGGKFTATYHWMGYPSGTLEVTHWFDLPRPAGGVLMTDILADYREWADQQPERIGTHSDRCHMWHRDCMIHRLARELTRTRDDLASATRHMGLAEAAWLRETSGNSPAAVVLTDEEQEALGWAARMIDNANRGDPKRAATLRGLLERTTWLTSPTPVRDYGR